MELTNDNAQLSVKIPGHNGQRNERFARKRSHSNSSLSRDARKKTAYEIESSLFYGAEARDKFYLIIKKAESAPNNFADLNFKVRLDLLRDLLCTTKFNMKKFKLRNDTFYKLEVCVESKNAMDKLLSTNMIGRTKIDVEENITKNTTKGLIIDHDAELNGMDTRQLLDAVTTEGVVDIHRYGKSIVLEVSFRGQKKPTHVHFWNKLEMKVKPYIDPPVRCFKCQKYGHMSRSCRSACYTCYKCAATYDDKQDHNTRDCTERRKCVNCNKEHFSGSNFCDAHKLEKRWAEICFDQKITREEAKRKYPDGKKPKFSGAAAQTGRGSNPQQSSQEQTTVESQEWRLQQGKQMAEIQKRLEIQEKLIKQLKEDIAKKDKDMVELAEEKEDLIVANDKLRVSANKTMAHEISSLKVQLQEKKEQEMTEAGISEIQALKLERDSLQRQLHASVDARKPNSEDGMVQRLLDEIETLKTKLGKSGEKTRELSNKNAELQKTVRDSLLTHAESPKSKKKKQNNTRQ